MTAPIETQIQEILSSSTRGLAAAELATILRCEKKTINSILYRGEGTKYRKSLDREAPIWRLQPEIENSEIQIDAVGRPENGTYPPRLCGSCGAASEAYFCSRGCRNKAIDLEIREILRVPEFEEFHDLLEFLHQDLTAPVLPSLCRQRFSIRDVTMTTNGSFLDVWERCDRDVERTVSVFQAEFETHLMERFTNSRFVDDLLIAIPNLSSRYRGEVIDALRAVGIEARRTSLIGHSHLLGLENISPGAQKNIHSVVLQNRHLVDEVSRRRIDQLTLDYVGASRELSECLNLVSPLSISSLEQTRGKRVSQLCDRLSSEFEELLLFLRAQNFLPTLEIVESLEVGMPTDLIDANKASRLRLIAAIDKVSHRQQTPSLKRVRLILSLLESLLQGATLEDLGKNLGVTRERARQLLEPIVSQCGAGNLRRLRELGQARKRRMEERRAEKISLRAGEIRDFISQHPGVLVDELILLFPDEQTQVRSMALRHRALILDSLEVEADTESLGREDILDSLRAASLLCFPVTGIAYDQLLADGFIQGVSRVRVMQVFGSWSHACARAGVESGESLKKVEYVRKYSLSELLRVVGQFLIDEDREGRAGGAHSYDLWRERQEFAESLPSSGTLRNQVHNSWREVRRMALIELRGTWAPTCDWTYCEK